MLVPWNATGQLVHETAREVSLLVHDPSYHFCGITIICTLYHFKTPFNASHQLTPCSTSLLVKCQAWPSDELNFVLISTCALTPAVVSLPSPVMSLPVMLLSPSSTIISCVSVNTTSLHLSSPNVSLPLQVVSLSPLHQHQLCHWQHLYVVELLIMNMYTKWWDCYRIILEIELLAETSILVEMPIWESSLWILMYICATWGGGWHSTGWSGY